MSDTFITGHESFLHGIRAFLPVAVNADHICMLHHDIKWKVTPCHMQIIPNPTSYDTVQLISTDVLSTLGIDTKNNTRFFDKSVLEDEMIQERTPEEEFQD